MFTPSFVSNVIRPGSWTSSATSTTTQTSTAQRRPARSAASPQRSPQPPRRALPAAGRARLVRESSSQRRGASLLPPQDQQQIPRQQLAQPGQEDEEPAPARVVPRPRLDHGDVGPPAHQGQDLADPDGNIVSP